MIRVALVGCGKKKRAGRHPARELYIGALFRKALRYAERNFIDIFVLSAKHGLVGLDQMLDCYDERMPTARDDQDGWAMKVAHDLEYKYMRCRIELTMLAGAAYIEPLRKYATRNNEQWTFHTPLSGMGVGQRLRWFNMVTAPRVREIKIDDDDEHVGCEHCLKGLVDGDAAFIVEDTSLYCSRDCAHNYDGELYDGRTVT